MSTQILETYPVAEQPELVPHSCREEGFMHIAPDLPCNWCGEIEPAVTPKYTWKTNNDR